MTHICVGDLTIIGSDNGLSPGRRIVWTNAGILLIGPSGTNFSEISIEIPTCSFKKIRLKVSSAKWRPYCFGLNALTGSYLHMEIYVSSHLSHSFILTPDIKRSSQSVRCHTSDPGQLILDIRPTSIFQMLLLYSWSADEFQYSVHLVMPR